MMQHQPKSKRPNKLKRKKQPYDYSNEPYDTSQGEKALWAAVITQAMMDALCRSTNSEAQYHKHEAICWLTGNSKDYIDVCLYAGLDPSYVRRKAKRAMANPSSWRAEPGKGDRYLQRKNYRKRIKEKHTAVEQPEESGTVIIGPWGNAPRTIHQS